MTSLSWNHTGAAQAQHSQDEQCVCRCAHAQTHRHTLTQYPLPPLNSPSFFISYLCLLVKVLLLLLLRCPESRMPRNHSGTSLALPHQPLARPKPGFSCLGLKTIRFFSSKKKMLSKESVDYSYSALKMHFKNSEMLQTV